MSGSTNGGVTRAYEALRESEELHRATLSNISDAVFLTDDDGVFTYICPNVDMIFGYVPDEVQAMTRISRLLGENLFDPAELAARGEIRNVEREIRTKSGEQRTVLVLIKAVSIKGGTVLYTCRDVTERSRAEDELRAVRRELVHASRLALVGELLASMTHEISQPLTAVVVNASAGLRLLHDQATLDRMQDIREILVDIGDEGRVAAAIIDRVRALSRKRPLELRRLDVNEVTREMLRLVGSDARRRGIAVNAELAPALPAVHADRVCLQQVMLNLMVNGMDAIDQVRGHARQLSIRTGRRENAVEIAVSDTGVGIPPERMPRLFDAFFTTKKEGIGLGLAIARSIVEAHRGRIWAEDNGGRGATFRLTVPAVA